MVFGKKGALDLALALLIILFLAVPLLLSIFGSSGKIFSAFFPSNDQHTIADFSLVAQTLGALLKDSHQYASDSLVLQLHPDYALVGFDTLWDPQQKHVSLDDSFSSPQHTSFSKPSFCNQQACLCLYRLTDDTSSPLQCVTYPETITFSGLLSSSITHETTFRDRGLARQDYHHPGNIPDDVPYEYLYLRGLKTPLTHVYLEKFVSTAGDVHFLLTPAKTALYDGTFRLLSRREHYLTLCPDQSDEVCRGQHDLSVIPDPRIPSDSLITYMVCLYDIFTSSCRSQPTIQCSDGKITSPCICSGNEVYTEDYCYNGYAYDEEINCNLIHTCQDYKKSSPFETLCNQDPCRRQCGFWYQETEAGVYNDCLYKPAQPL